MEKYYSKITNKRSLDPEPPSTLLMIVNTIGVSCKRKDSLLQLHHDEVVERIEKGELSTGRGQNQEINLARPGDTRWGSHYKTILRLFEMWNSLGTVLLALHEDGSNAQIRNTATGLIEKMYTFDFVFVGKFILKILGYTRILSQVLQKRDQDIRNAIRSISVTKKALQDFRDSGWDGLLNDASTFCELQNIEVPSMEAIVPGRGKQLIDGAPKTYYHHFHVDVFAKVLDLILQEFNNHFTEENTDLLQCIMCFDPSHSFSKIDKEKLFHLARIYSDDFSSADLMELDHQLDIYIQDVKSNEEFDNLEDIGALVKKMVELGYDKNFCFVYRLLELILVLPVGTASVERCFSAMNVVKTNLRNRMGDDLLSDSLLCYIEKEIFSTIKTESIMQCFQKLASRRNTLPPPGKKK